MNLLTKKILFLSLAFIFVLPVFSFGQDLPTPNLLSLKMVPENPEPFALVKITVESSSYDLARSKITWLVNGATKKTEIGLTSFSTEAGRNGQKTTIKVVVDILNEGPKEIEAFFIPSVVDLIYESLAYTPPFYKGRALNPNQGVVLVTAIPELIKTNGEKVPLKNIIYSWKKDGKVEQASSGLGKNTFVFSGTVPIRDSVISVTASSLEGDIFASKQINITNYPSKIIFYEDSPIYGIMFNRAVNGAVRLLADEFKAKAFPYFMSVGYSQSPNLNYNWVINGKKSENLEADKSAMVFRQEGPGAGTASVDLKIENTVRIFQFADNNFMINFEKE